MAAKRLSLVPGKPYGYLKFVRVVEDSSSRHTKGLFECLYKSCGREKVTNLSSVKLGLTQSCGCLQKERASNANTARRKYSPNLALFGDDRGLGYACGLIATDGNLNAKDQSIELCLKSTDLQTVTTFAKLLVENPEIRYRHNRQQCRFSVTFRELYQYCLEMGITPNKSKTLNIVLTDKSDDFKRYFFRGVLDGDGCVSIGKLGRSHRIIIYSASLKFLESLQACTSIHSTIETKGLSALQSIDIRGQQYVGYGCAKLVFTGKSAKALAAHFPLDEFCMKRKTEKLETILSSLRKAG